MTLTPAPSSWREDAIKNGRVRSPFQYVELASVRRFRVHIVLFGLLVTVFTTAPLMCAGDDPRVFAFLLGGLPTVAVLGVGVATLWRLGFESGEFRLAPLPLVVVVAICVGAIWGGTAGLIGGVALTVFFHEGAIIFGSAVLGAFWAGLHCAWFLPLYVLSSRPAKLITLGAGLALVPFALLVLIMVSH